MSSVEALVEVRLLDVPLVLRERSRQHGADLLREMELLRSGEESGSASHTAPRRLLELTAELDRVYAPYIASSTDEMDAAVDRGEESLPEVVHRLPAGSAAFVAHLAQVLEEVEDYCRAGDLLAMAPPPHIAAYRQWAISEVQRQVAGEPPTPWPVFAARAALGPEDHHDRHPEGRSRSRARAPSSAGRSRSRCGRLAPQRYASAVSPADSRL